MLLNPILMEMQVQQQRREKLERAQQYKRLPKEFDNASDGTKPKRAASILKLKSLVAWIISLLPTFAKAATISMPVNGCTIYKPRLFSFFDTCAEFSAVTGRNGCTKVKGICPYCITYQGSDVQMWLPDFVVEASAHFGRSMFAESISGAALKLHLKAATRWASSNWKQFELMSDGTGMDTAHGMFWQVRVLPLPFGSLVTTFPPLASSKGVGLPICYSSLSELDIAEWTYGIADAPAAAALATVAIPACFSPLGAAANSIGQTIAAHVGGSETSGSGFPSGCALPVPAKFGLAKTMMPTSDAWNPTKLCIGSLGSLIPRMGMVFAGDTYKSALLAAVKMASLTADHFGDSNTGGWNVEDKWQLVYPPSPHGYCFRPGQLSTLTEFPTGVLEDPATRAADNVSLNARSGTYVWVVWRKRNSCEEPFDAVWRADYKINKAKNLAICKAASSIP